MVFIYEINLSVIRGRGIRSRGRVIRGRGIRSRVHRGRMHRGGVIRSRGRMMRGGVMRSGMMRFLRVSHSVISADFTFVFDISVVLFVFIDIIIDNLGATIRQLDGVLT